MIINVKKPMNGIKKNIANIKPIILCITNSVTINDIANACLSIGGIPIMSNDLNDAKKILINANALLINTGTIDSKQAKMMLALYKLAKKNNKLVIVDPVGYGISKIRTKIINIILKDSYKKVIIKGNQTEITKILNKDTKITSVNNSLSIGNLNELKKMIKAISKKYNKIICMTGKYDIVTDGNNIYGINNGNKNMELITGTGCMLGVIIATFASVSKNIVKSTALAALFFGISGELAFADSIKDGVYHAKNNLLNNLFLLMNDIDLIEKRKKIIYDEK